MESSLAKAATNLEHTKQIIVGTNCSVTSHQITEMKKRNEH